MKKYFVCLIVVASLLLASSMDADRRRPVRVGPSTETPKTSLSVLGPNEKGEYSVPFSSWAGLPAGVTFTGYSIDVDGNRTYLGHGTVTNETANRGWAGQLIGGLTGGWAPMPEGVVAFRVEFTGDFFATYSVNAKVPDGLRVVPLVDVYPDGKLFLQQGYAVHPVASLLGNGHAVVSGWITPIPYFYGMKGVPVAVCSGYPESWCLTQVVDIPIPPTQGKSLFSEK